MNHVKHPDVIFDKMITWRLNIKLIEAKAYKTYIRSHSLFKSERLSGNFKFTFHEAPIRSVMTYICPAWEFEADTYPLELQRLQNKSLSTTGTFPGRTPVRELHVAFHAPYIYDYITKLWKQRAEIIQNHGNINVSDIGKGEV
jgi:hypothetical protein